VESLSAEQLRSALLSMLHVAAAKDQELAFKQAIIDKLTHENALLRRMKFAAQSERFSPEQKSLLEDEIEADLAAVASQIDALAQVQTPTNPEKKQARRLPLPAHLPRREIRYEPTSTTCACGCQIRRVGEDVAEKLDDVPGVFSVERQIRGKWACAQCETIQQVPVEAHVIDKGIPTTGLLAQVLVGKYAGPPAAVPAGGDLRSCRPGHPALDAGAMGGHLRGAAAAAGRGAQGTNAPAPRAACRRDTGADAQARQRQDAPGVPVGLRPGGV